MATNPELLGAIRTFYDNYHRGRVRTADQWMQQVYWPSFVGETLEVGGGTLLPDRSAYMVADLSTEAARRASRNAKTALVADGTSLPFGDGSFDTVACYDVLEHVIDLSGFVAEMCRVARQRVVVAGPNYVGTHSGGMSRYLPLRLYSFLIGSGRGYIRIKNPYLSFDEHWFPDRDAVSALNVAWVASEFRRHGLRLQQMSTWQHNYRWLNMVPALRCLGRFMFVVGVKL